MYNGGRGWRSKILKGGAGEKSLICPIDGGHGGQIAGASMWETRYMWLPE